MCMHCQMYKRALAVRPSDADVLSNLGQLQLELNNSAVAEEIWSKILKCSCQPRVPDVHQVSALHAGRTTPLDNEYRIICDAIICGC